MSCIIAPYLNSKGYSVTWRDIVRPDILRRDNYKCSHCSVKNNVLFYNENGVRKLVDDNWLHSWAIKNNIKLSKVCLSISHSCHNSACINYSHLTTLCQACHLRYDKHHHLMSRLINASQKRVS